MTRFKKSLALFLALVMMFSTMTIAASAWNYQTDDGFAITYTTKFFRLDAESGEWIETTRAKPGEAIKARVYVATDYATNSGENGFQWDSRYLKTDFVDGVKRGVTTNSEYMGGICQLSCDTAVWQADETKFLRQNPGNILVTNGKVPADFFDNNDLIALALEFGSNKNYKLVDTDWAFEFDMQVLNNELTNTVNSSGSAQVPALYNSLSTCDAGYLLFVDMPKGEEGATRDSNWAMSEWEPEFTTNAATVSTTSDFILNANGGTFASNGTDTSKASGIIGTSASNLANTEAPVRAGFAFEGWSTEQISRTDLSDEELANVLVDGSDLAYDYDDQTVYAVWSKAPTSYTLNEYVMDVNGSYPTTPNTRTVKAEAGEVVTPAAAPEGFSLDTAKSDASIIVSTDSTSVLNVYYSRNKYTATYHYNDGTEPHEVFYGAVIPSPDYNPHKEGSRFVDWSLNSDNTSNPVPSSMPAEDVDIYPVWEDIPYTYIFDAGEGAQFSDGNRTKSTVYYFGDVPAYPAEKPTKADHEFTSWSPDLPATVSGDATFTANYVYSAHQLSYHLTEAPEGAQAPEAAKGLKEGDKVVLAAPTDVEGYTFNGWVYDGGDPIAPGTEFEMPDGSVELEGSYSAKEYTITFDSKGGSAVADIKVKCGETVDSLPESTKVGSKFSGWMNESGVIVTTPFVMGAADLALTAAWDVVSYTLTLNAGTGEFADSSSIFTATVPYGTKLADISLPANPTKEGYIFRGWANNDGVPTTLPETMPAINVSLNAIWEPIPTFVLTLDAGEGLFANGDNSIEFEYPEGTDISGVEEPTREGYEFDGWNNMPEDGKMPAEDLTLEAKWARVKHKITYKLPDGTVYDEYSVEEEAAIPAPAEDPEIEGYTFVKWAVNEDGTEPVPEVMGTSDIVATAFFSINSYKVTYMNKGEVYQEYEDVVYGSEVPVPADPESADPELEVFAGWQPKVPATMPARDLVFEAEWKAPRDYSVTYLLDDGKTYEQYTGLMPGDSVPVPPEDPEKFGYKFVGWEPEVPATMPAEDLVFTAQWEIDKEFVAIVVGGTVVAGGAIAAIVGASNAALITGVSIVGGVLAIGGIAALVKHTHTVTYMVDGEVYKTYKVLEGTKIPVPADPEKDGAEFTGWNPEVPEKMGSEDLVFEATWDNVDVDIPSTGSAAAGITAFAVISGAAAAAYVIVSRKKED